MQQRDEEVARLFWESRNAHRPFSATWERVAPPARAKWTQVASAIREYLKDGSLPTFFGKDSDLTFLFRMAIGDPQNDAVLRFRES